MEAGISYLPKSHKQGLSVMSSQMQLLLKLLDYQAPEFGVALADDKKTYKIYPDHIKDLCVSYSAIIDKEDLEYSKSKGYPGRYQSSSEP